MRMRKDRGRGSKYNSPSYIARVLIFSPGVKFWRHSRKYPGQTITKVYLKGVIMAKKYTTSVKKSTRTPPATTPEGREQQLVALAMDATEQRIRNGTVSAQELVYLMKAGSPTAKTEKQILELQKQLIAAKTEALKSQKRVEELYSDALKAMRAYSGADNVEDNRYDD